MRCPSCNKFVPYDEPQCEVDDVAVDGDQVRASVTVQLNCADCGETLKDAQIESDAAIDHKCEGKNKFDGDQFEVEDQGEPEGTSRTQDTDRNGKPIKLSRYMKTFYGFTIEPEIKCLKCDQTFSVTIEGDEQASGFNECC